MMKQVVLAPIGKLHSEKADLHHKDSSFGLIHIDEIHGAIVSISDF